MRTSVLRLSKAPYFLVYSAPKTRQAAHTQLSLRVDRYSQAARDVSRQARGPLAAAQGLSLKQPNPPVSASRGRNLKRLRVANQNMT